MAGGCARVSEVREFLGRVIERLRNGVLLRLPPHEQGFTSTLLDGVQDYVRSGRGNPIDILGSVQRAKDTTRRVLRTRPLQMLEVLHELEGFEEELAGFIEAWERAQRLGETA